MSLAAGITRLGSLPATTWLVSALALLSSMVPLVASSADSAGGGTPRPPMVALVVDAVGSIKPAVTSYAELAPGAHFELAPKAHITLMHYAACKRVSVEGGSLVVTERAVEVTGATANSSEPGPCPNVRHIVGPGNTLSTGALISGGGLQPEPRLASTQRVVLVGDRATLARDARILDAGGHVIAGPWAVANHAFSLGDARTLVPGDAYTLQVEFRSDIPVLKVPFTAASTGADALFVLRLE